jgi:hypothetical protein
MKNQVAIPTAPQSEAPVPQRMAYASPQAAFVPLKLDGNVALKPHCDPSTCTEGSYIK